MLFCVSVVDYFLLLSGVLLYEYTPVFIREFIDKCLGCFQFCVLTHEAALSIVWAYVLISLGWKLQGEECPDCIVGVCLTWHVFKSLFQF